MSDTKTEQLGIGPALAALHQEMQVKASKALHEASLYQEPGTAGHAKNMAEAIAYKACADALTPMIADTQNLETANAYYRGQVTQLEAALAASEAQLGDYRESKSYLTSLLMSLSPLSQPAKRLALVVSQIDNYIAGQRDELAASEAQLKEARRFEAAIFATLHPALDYVDDMNAEGLARLIIERFSASEARIRELEAKQYVDDGQWICETCGFRLMKAVLRAHDGAVGVDRSEVQDICPNDGTSMRRLTWKEDADNANRVGLDMMKRNDVLMQALQSIANSSCCPPCQEAALVAKHALAGAVPSGEASGPRNEHVKLDEAAKPEVGPMQDTESLSGVQTLGSSGPSIRESRSPLGGHEKGAVVGGETSDPALAWPAIPSIPDGTVEALDADAGSTPADSLTHEAAAVLALTHGQQQDQQRITELEARCRVLEQDSHILRKCNIIEIAVANETGSVSEYMNHWEGRALKAESQLAAADAARHQAEQGLESVLEIAERNIALTDATTRGGQHVGYSPTMQRSQALELRKIVLASRPPRAAPRKDA